MDVSTLKAIPRNERVALLTTTGVEFTGYVRVFLGLDNSVVVINDGQLLEAGDRPKIHDVTVAPEYIVSFRYQR